MLLSVAPRRRLRWASFFCCELPWLQIHLRPFSAWLCSHGSPFTPSVLLPGPLTPISPVISLNSQPCWPKACQPHSKVSSSLTQHYSHLQLWFYPYPHTYTQPRPAQPRSRNPGLILVQGPIIAVWGMKWKNPWPPSVAIRRDQVFITSRKWSCHIV